MGTVCGELERGLVLVLVDTLHEEIVQKTAAVRHGLRLGSVVLEIPGGKTQISGNSNFHCEDKLSDYSETKIGHYRDQD